MRKIKRRMTKRKQRGGEMLNCAKEGFSDNMKQAALGHGYKKPVGMIHGDGELWSFEKLKEFTLDGRMVDWWITNQKFPYTKDELETLKTNEILAILGAFYHRYKVVAERYAQAKKNTEGGVKQFFPEIKNSLSGPNSYTKPEALRIHKTIREYFPKLQEYAKNQKELDFFIQTALDRVQCVMFYIVKHKGELPPGFTMDPRIEEKAREPISLTTDDAHPEDSLKINNPLRKIESTLKTLNIIKKENKELTPVVTFGIFENIEFFE